MEYFLIFVFVILLFFHLVTRYSRKGRIVSGIPGPWAYPIFGNVLMFNTSCMHKFWEIAKGVSDKYYPIHRYWLSASPLIVIRHPDDVEILFSSRNAITKGFFYDYLHPWLRQGLLTSTGKLWHQRRKLLTPAFHFSILKKYMEITSDEVTRTVTSLKAEGNESIQSLIPFCSEYTLNVVCESAMGVSLHSMDQTAVGEYKKAIHDQGNIVLYRMPRPYVTDWILPFINKWGSLQRKVLKILHGFTAEVIKDRRKYHERTDFKYLEGLLEENDEEKVNVGGKRRRLCMLDLLLDSQRNNLIDAKGIQEEVDTFTFEGHDTTGMALAFTLLLLSENKSAQELARREAVEVLDQHDGKIDLTILQELKYTERCIKESLRMYPPVATMMRQTSADLQLKNALVPANTHVMVRLFDMHRDPNFWPEPEKFDPDRFLLESMKDRHPFSYIPFSAGPRNCIGQKFAMMELKAIIARVLYDFYLEPVDHIADMKLIADIILRPLDPIRVKFIKIDRNL